MMQTGKALNVLLVSANFSPHVGGIERFTEILANELTARDHRVTVLCCRYGAAPLDESARGFGVRRIRSSYVLEKRLGVPYPVPEPSSLLKELRRALAQADVVHVQDAIYATSVAALVLARRRGVPSVLTQHVAFVPQAARWLDAVERSAVATLGRSARLATRVATLNPAVCEWVGQTWGVRASVLPVGIPAPRAPDPDRASLRASFDLPEGRFVALFVGRDVPKKGLDTFLASAAPDYDLVAVTDRPGPSETARVLPFMSSDRLHDLMACVDAFVLPASPGEGFPLVLQEALVIGLPVVTTKLPGYEHYLSDDDVLFVPAEPAALRETLTRLSGDEALRRRFGERALAAGRRNFGVERFVSAYEELYFEARDEHARAA